MKEWTLAEAQEHVEEIFDAAVARSPQRIVVAEDGKAVVVLGVHDYARLVRPEDVDGFLRNSPVGEAHRTDSGDARSLEQASAADPPASTDAS